MVKVTTIWQHWLVVPCPGVA